MISIIQNKNDTSTILDKSGVATAIENRNGTTSIIDSKGNIMLVLKQYNNKRKDK